ncbi:MAG TPA: hypothetical protein VFJ85_04940 [Acidimicrobiales bacterium]|nr:hypothetical protein [Acidimicrobiales bacterium]
MAVGAAGEVRDDRLLAPTFWTAVVIVPVLVAAFVILYLFSTHTKALWAWTIAIPMSAKVMGAGYVSGSTFFFRTAYQRRWHRVAIGFLSITGFTTLLLLATLLHWSKFNHVHVSFWAWLLLYAITPPLLPWLWYINQRTDPGTPDDLDTLMPDRLRRLVAFGGVLQTTFAVLLFVWPSLFADRWPWPVTPLTARCIAAYVIFPGIAWMLFAREARWSCFRITMQTITFALCLIGVGALLTKDSFAGRPASSVWGFAIALATMIGLLVWLQVAMDRRRTPQGA